MGLLFRVTLIGIMLALLSQSMLSSATRIQSASVIGTTGTSDTSSSPLWYGIGSDWRIYHHTPQNPNGTPLALPELLQGWQADIDDRQKKYGFNSIRLAFSFADSSGENRTHNVLNMTELDSVLQLFSGNSIKVILDLHDWADSARNGSDMPGFFGTSKWIADWKDVASRYKDNTEILAYEIFNEPDYKLGTWDSSVTGGGCGVAYNGSGKSVPMALAECVDAIRSVGDYHPIIYPPPNYFTVTNNESDPELFFNSLQCRPNIVVTFHNWFWNSSESYFQASWNNRTRLMNSWKSYFPIWIGEFGMFDNSSFQTEACSQNVRWAVENQVGFNMFVARSNPTAREEQWNMSESALAAFTPDVTSPVTVNDYDGLWHNVDFAINLVATDNESGVAETYYRINNWSVETTRLDGQPRIISEGANMTLEYWSIDNMGNEELPHEFLSGIKLDKAAPTIDISSRVPDSGVQPNQEVRVSVNVTDLMSGVKNVTLSCNLNDNGTWIDSLMTFNSSTYTYEALIPGQLVGALVKYGITAYDNAGNVGKKDNGGQYYAYTVIPEFRQSIVLILLALTTSLAILLKKGRTKCGKVLVTLCHSFNITQDSAKL